MGLLDLFNKSSRAERGRQKNIERALKKYAQSPDRMKALEALRDDGSPEAIYGMLRRFALMYDKSIEDEQEKDWVFDTLCEKGASIIPELKRYLLAADSISWPLRLLGKVASRPQEIEVLRAVLEKHEPGYERDPSKKIQLMSRLGALKDAALASLIAPYLADMDEGVRFASVEALFRAKNEEVSREPLLELFVSDKEESLRIRIRIAEGFADVAWLVRGHRGLVEKKLPDQFQLDREGHIKRKPGRDGGGSGQA